MDRIINNRIFRLACIFVITLVAFQNPGHSSERKVALVLGNGNYEHISSLRNPKNDAEAMGKKLRGLGYEVFLGLDLKRENMFRTASRFADALDGADVALLHYSGHGLQINGENYLLPSDIKVTTEMDVKRNALGLNSLLAMMERRARTRVIFLDACRNNPLTRGLKSSSGTRSTGATRGLSRVTAGIGSFIAFSTQPGNVALDGTGRNSPFTSALLQHIDTPGIDIHGVLRNVRNQVRRDTSDGQIPWENSSLIERFFFADKESTIEKPVAPMLPKRKAPKKLHFVSGLDPHGDNFLALKTGPGINFKRIAKLGPGTRLEVLGRSGNWRNVRLADGRTGWAHSRWIYCCRNQGQNHPVNTSNSKFGSICSRLWYERNLIWHRRKYCFGSKRGLAAFSNDGCFRTLEQAKSVMSNDELERIAELVAEERDRGCR